jgi:large subunit ribosomal protein L15
LMATRRRKVRRQRGSRFHGWGTSGQHRESGMLGGHGNAGLLRGKKSAVIRYGSKAKKKGLLPKLPDEQRFVVNVGQLEDLLANPESAQAVTEHEGKMLLDLGSLGYSKLLGSGKVQTPILVKIEKYSKSALAKIEAAGGRIEKPAV